MKKVPLGAAAAAVLAWAVFAMAPSCVDSIDVAGVGGGDAGYDAGFAINSDGEACTRPLPDSIRAHFVPSRVFLEPCAAEPCPTRTVKLVVEPDLCAAVNAAEAGAVGVAVDDGGFEIDDAGNNIIGPNETQVVFTPMDPDVVRQPVPTLGELCTFDQTQYCVGYHRPTLEVPIEAGKNTGSSTLQAAFKYAGETFTATLDVEVLPDEVPACSGQTSTPKLTGGDTLSGKGGLAGATITLPKGADKEDISHSPWQTDPFAASVACSSSDIVPKGFVALGPPITFGPEDKVLQREIPVTIPINPALMPVDSRMRHVRVAYSGPAFKKPRTIPVADPYIVNINGTWALNFQIPRLGTYQAVIANDAGSKSFTRRLTHRAVTGISMGGGGTAMFVARHHNLFDVMAPLGGPVDWTWELNYIENNHLGGFRPIAPGTTLANTPGGATQLATPCDSSTQCKSDETCLGVIKGTAMSGSCTLLPTPTEPYEHPQAYNFWWYEYPSDGNGGHFGRQDYGQIFRDLAIMFGNPNGMNLSKNAQNLPAGVNPNDKSVLGEHKNGECKMWVDPIDCTSDPNPDACRKFNDQAQQQAIANSCPTERCANTLTLQNYFSAEYNPDGTFPVITICDSSPQIEGASPYANEWQAGMTGYPLEVALAVDYNGNGVRDAMEPIVRAGHEKWYDDGVDHTPSRLEPGYVKGKNDDPAGDDYNAQYNPTGTEGDHRFEPGEKFDDFGLDGVPNTKQQPASGWSKPGDGYDVGEGDGKFTVAAGLQTFWDRDPYSIVRGLTSPAKIPAGELDDQALQRLDCWTDGGVRDLFNFSVDAQNLVGGFFARGRNVQYLTDFSYTPGSVPGASLQFNAKQIIFEDLPGVVFARYGAVNPTSNDIAGGSGKHVGTGPEILNRIQSAMYFIGSRWPEPELRTLSYPSRLKPSKSATKCEVAERCDIEFPDGNMKIATSRSGPVTVSLPPGYALDGNEGLRYPVVFFLHGYGQDPSDLAAVEALFPNWMNDPNDSIATRMPKMIVVYVDGRCRWQQDPDGKKRAECLRGTFFGDSVMSQGAQDESWWLELVDFVDQNFRTLGAGEVEWTE